jgi:hypothetical protein
MSNIVSIEEWKRRKAAEHMVVPCGTGKISITWTSKPSNEDLAKLRKAGEGFRKTMKEFQDACEV